jgi:hypothetical protein
MAPTRFKNWSAYSQDAACRVPLLGRVRELKGAILEAERVGNGFEPCLVSACEDGREAPTFGECGR